MAPVIGIDLGTTNTVVAVVKDGHAQAIPDETGSTLLPSVVSFHPNGSVLVGRAAKERRLVDAPNTIYSVKRLIGRSWDSPEVSTARTRFAFQMREGPGQATLVVGRGETYTLPEISAFVLRRAKQVAEAALGASVDRAVITVPANFNDLQRAATKVAGRVAGLDVLRILNEPTAAALAYGFGKAASERIAVYDFGGGTFDVTLLDLSDNVFEVLATAGNTFLGGDDIDVVIAERIADQFLARHRFDPRSDPQAFERLRAGAEQLKQKLSSEAEAGIELTGIAHGAGGKSLDLSFRMTRAELERQIMPIVDRTFDVCKEALSIAQLTARDFEQVLLVGGSTRIPFVRRRVEQFFGRELRAGVNPEEAVALGAAIQANALGAAERRRAPVPQAPAAARRPTVGVLPAPRQRAETIPGVAPPSTQSFGEPRPPLASDSSADAALGVLATGARVPLGTQTLEGLGARGKLRTGSGLGAGPAGGAEKPAPEAAPAPERPRAPAAPTARAEAATGARQESVAFALGENDIEEITQVPPGKRPPPPKSRPGESAYRQEDIITKSGESPRDPAEEEPTKSGRSRPATLELDVARALLDTAPFGPSTTQPLPAIPALAVPAAPSASAPELPKAPEALAQPSKPVVAQTPFKAPAHAPPAPLIPAPTVATPRAATPFNPGATAPFNPGATAPFNASRAFDPAAPINASAFGGAASGDRLSQPLVPGAAGVAALALGGGPAPAQRAPLLVDVTPLTLVVETVSGYCDPIIGRNTPVPCEQSRDFVTASDGQTVVRVRVAQGESKRFSENTLLGEVELLGLPARPRGEVPISVTFALDVSGMLSVSARETATGHATRVELRLIGLSEGDDASALAQRQIQRQTA